MNEVRDASALAEAAEELLERYDTILASGACRHAAEDFFSANKGAEKYQQLYQEIIARYGAGRRAEKTS